MTFHWQNYSKDYETSWNEFVSSCKNACFLFYRDYMEYHKDRFQDASMVCLDEKGTVICIFPANISGTTVYSHQGLTFGGLFFEHGTTLRNQHEILNSLIALLKTKGCEKLIIKPLPSAFYVTANDDLNFLLSSCSAQVYRRDLNLVIHSNSTPNVQERRVRGAKKALKAGIVIKECTNYAAYWEKVLIPVLRERHGVAPTHSLSEIENLSRRFPNDISLLGAFLENEIVAGIVTYNYPQVTHAQYIGANNIGKDLSALDLLCTVLSDKTKSIHKHLSFGIATENEGKSVNWGLLEWKMGFGAQTVCHDHFMLVIN